MSRNVDAAIDLILIDEGGIADVGDGKGVTRFGQTPGWLEDNGFTPPSNAADAASNYSVWMQRHRLDELCDIDVTVGHIVTDDAVHSTVGDAIRRLQRSLAGVTVDGVLGPLTLDAVRRADPATLACNVLAEKLEHRGQLLGSLRTDRRKFAAGWCNRIAKQIRALPWHG